MAQKNHKISFCVVCMNRLHQLKETLLKNINDNDSYNELEFIVLDYNSKDGMEQWAKENLGAYILNGRVIYYKTTEPNAWSPSHSKNLAFKLATGNIVCSIWADYYTGVGFADYVNNMFKLEDNIVLTPIDFYKTKNNHNPPGDVLGKVCVKKSDFMKINGFDERMNKHGFEDYDFINRLEIIGVKRVLIEDFSYLKFISHDNNERYLLSTDNLQAMYVNYIAASSSEVLFLYKNQSFKRGVMIDNFTNHANDYSYAYQSRNNHFEYSLKEPGWEMGTWSESDGNLILLSESNDELVFSKQNQNEHNSLVDTKRNRCFYCMDDEEIINSVLVFDHFYYTRFIMEENLKNKIAIVNPDGFGSATVFKNFQAKNPITIL